MIKIRTTLISLESTRNSKYIAQLIIDKYVQGQFQLQKV